MMKCKLCGSEEIQVIYNGLIRDGGLGKYTKEPINMWRCENCGIIWHDLIIGDIKQYYESTQYRNSLEGSSAAETFYKLHDKETLDKFQYTGTDIFRQKVVADIGCGCGAFLDFLKGVAKTIVAIEPSETYRIIMREKGFRTYVYAEEAKKDWKADVNVITSFDVIEHVENPKKFMYDIYDLLSVDGKGIIGTPTDAPIMRCLLGQIYEQRQLFSTQHLWIFSKNNLKMLAEEVGFKKVEFKYFQRYGISNLLGWLKEKEPCSDISSMHITDTLDNVWKSECSAHETADYLVAYLYK